jgi:hypothetical protein
MARGVPRSTCCRRVYDRSEVDDAEQQQQQDDDPGDAQDPEQDRNHAVDLLPWLGRVA